jgi:hypothetical protein
MRYETIEYLTRADFPGTDLGQSGGKKALLPQGNPVYGAGAPLLAHWK